MQTARLTADLYDTARRDAQRLRAQAMAQASDHAAAVVASFAQRIWYAAWRATDSVLTPAQRWVHRHAADPAAR